MLPGISAPCGVQSTAPHSTSNQSPASVQADPQGGVPHRAPLGGAIGRHSSSTKHAAKSLNPALLCQDLGIQYAKVSTSDQAIPKFSAPSLQIQRLSPIDLVLTLYEFSGSRLKEYSINKIRALFRTLTRK